jgi:polysaccharide pyruvyl transferase WcaK-like protein
VEKQNRRRIALLGVTRNTDNYGVRVLLSSAIEVLSNAEKESDMILLDYGKEPEEWRESTSNGERDVRLVNLRFSWRMYLPNNIFRLVGLAAIIRAFPGKDRRRLLANRNLWLREITQRYAFYSIAGGDSFSDIYGLRRLLYVTLPQILVLLMEKPLILLPQTYGPFKTGTSRTLARWILRRAQAVYSRDTDGIDTIKTLTGESGPDVHVVPDIGFYMKCEPVDAKVISFIENIKSRGPLIGLNISKLLYMGGYTGNNMFQLREPFPALVDALVSYIVRNLGGQILLIPHVCGNMLSQEDETSLCKQLRENYSASYGDRVDYIDRKLNHRQMKTVIGKCDMFIGARMHACIGAVSQGVPTVCLAYSSKFAGVMRPLGDGAKIADLRVVTIADVINEVGRVFVERGILRRQLEEKLHEFEEKKILFLANKHIR